MTTIYRGGALDERGELFLWTYCDKENRFTITAPSESELKFKADCLLAFYQHIFKGNSAYPRQAEEVPTYTYREWAEEWYRLYKEPRAKLNYKDALRGYLNRVILPVFGDTELSDIRALDLQRFLCEIPSDNTRTKIAAILSESLRKAWEIQLIPANPFLAVEFKKYEPPKLGALTHAQQLKLIGAIPKGRMYVLTYFLLCTGLRQGEALALFPEDFDLERGCFHVTKSLERKSNALVPPKTKSSTRTVPIAPPLTEMLRPYMKPGKRIFPYRADSISRWYRKKFHALELPKSGHMIRHTFITNCYELGIPPYVVQRWVGHAKLEQADTYLALRQAKDFIHTEFVEYILELKRRFVVPHSN